MNKREKERINTAFTWVQRKLGTNFHIYFEQFDSDKEEGSDDAGLMVGRTNRETQDELCFTIYFDPKKTKKRAFNRLKRDLFHETLHLMNWGRRDIFDETLKYVKNTQLRKALEKRFYDCDESITFTMERSLGPYIIAKWDKDEV